MGREVSYGVGGLGAAALGQWAGGPTCGGVVAYEEDQDQAEAPHLAAGLREPLSVLKGFDFGGSTDVAARDGGGKPWTGVRCFHDVLVEEEEGWVACWGCEGGKPGAGAESGRHAGADGEDRVLPAMEGPGTLGKMPVARRAGHDSRPRAVCGCAALRRFAGGWLGAVRRGCCSAVEASAWRLRPLRLGVGRR